MTRRLGNGSRLALLALQSRPEALTTVFTKAVMKSR